jgi:hypothetical protein
LTDYLDVTHIALEVHADLREAESYYCELFDLQLSWREPVPSNAPFDLPWDQIEAAGLQPEIVLVASGAFRLAIESSAAPRRGGPVSHIGLQVTVDQLRRVSGRARQRHYRVINERKDEIFDFVDRYGMEWELDTRSFANPRLIVEQKRERERGRV